MNKRDQEREKTLLISLPASLYTELSAWAGEESRSVEKQIETILSACVRQRHENVEDKFDNQSPLFWLLQAASALLGTGKEDRTNG